MNQTNPINVWEIEQYFQKNNSFPTMTKQEKEFFLDFAIAQVKDCVSAYERYTYNHGGLRQEAKDMFVQIQEAEKMRNAIRKEVENQ